MVFSYEAVTLALLRLRGVGSRTVKALWQKQPSLPVGAASDLLELLRCHCKASVTERLDVDVVAKALADACGLLDQCEREGICVIAPDQPRFPKLLRAIPDSPLLLFSKGQLDCLNSECVAVIGTRNPTDYGSRCARKMASTLVENGWVIVSGLAEGCDTAGHEGCISASEKTVAFLAHGFGKIYPASNKALAQKIIDTGGCLSPRAVCRPTSNLASFRRCRGSDTPPASRRPARNLLPSPRCGCDHKWAAASRLPAPASAPCSGAGW